MLKDFGCFRQQSSRDANDGQETIVHCGFPATVMSDLTGSDCNPMGSTESGEFGAEAWGR